MYTGTDSLDREEEFVVVCVCVCGVCVTREKDGLPMTRTSAKYDTDERYSNGFRPCTPRGAFGVTCINNMCDKSFGGSVDLT